MARYHPNSAVVFSTGWSRNLARKDYFTKNPGLSASAAKYHVLLKSGILILENLCNLDKIQRTDFMLIVLPLKLKDATGSPVRSVAI